MTQDFNAMQLSQNQNHPHLTNNHPNLQRNNTHESLHPSIPNQQQYWQQQPRSSPVPRDQFQNPPANTYPMNANAMPYPNAYSTDTFHSVPPPNNNVFTSTGQRNEQNFPPPPHSGQPGDRTFPPGHPPQQPGSRTFPPGPPPQQSGERTFPSGQPPQQQGDRIFPTGPPVRPGPPSHQGNRTYPTGPPQQTGGQAFPPGQAPSQPGGRAFPPGPPGDLTFPPGPPGGTFPQGPPGDRTFQPGPQSHPGNQPFQPEQMPPPGHQSERTFPPAGPPLGDQAGLQRKPTERIYPSGDRPYHSGPPGQQQGDRPPHPQGPPSRLPNQPDNFGPSNQQQDLRPLSVYTNGTRGVSPSIPPGGQYQHINSNLQGHYQPSPSPVPGQGGMHQGSQQYGQPPPGSGPQQPQNRLPQPPPNRRLDPDNMPSPVSKLLLGSFFFCSRMPC